MASTLFFRIGLALVGLTALSSMAAAQTPSSPAGAATTVASPQTMPKGLMLGSRASSDETDYKIGSQDLLEIAVYGQTELTRTVRVNSRGKISLPLVGQLDALGLTALQLERLIADRLNESLLQNPQVSVFVKEAISARFTIEGAVTRPGVFPISGQLTLLRAIALAGGQGAMADLTNVKLFRVKPTGDSETFTYDMDKIRLGDQPDPFIVNDDVIVIARSKARAALKDSLLGDLLGIFNPFSVLLK